MASPPKPWERAGAGGTSTGESHRPKIAARSKPSSRGTNFVPGVTPTSAASAATPTATSEPPALPSRPSSLSSTVNQNASNYSTMNRPYGSGYGTGYGSSYSSPYSSMGGYGGGYGSSMYGRSMYGGGMYGGGYGGYGMGGGMYGGMGGMPGDPNNPQGLTQSFSQSTAATFQMLESIVGAFGGFAQMLESTYMATHSSFFGKSPAMHCEASTDMQISYGISCRAIWQPAADAWFRARHFHPDAVDPNRYRKTHRPSSASIIQGIDACELPFLQWPYA